MLFVWFLGYIYIYLYGIVIITSGYVINRLLLELADEIAPYSLYKLLNMSLSLDVVPSK